MSRITLDAYKSYHFMRNAVKSIIIICELLSITGPVRLWMQVIRYNTAQGRKGWHAVNRNYSILVEFFSICLLKYPKSAFDEKAHYSAVWARTGPGKLYYPHFQRKFKKNKNSVMNYMQCIYNSLVFPNWCNRLEIISKITLLRPCYKIRLTVR